jgi:radical SAM-linked protein
MATDRHRYRITFSKGEPLKYTSHLDLMRIWTQSLRRVGAPLAYSRGFNPRPKLQLAAALPLGHTGEAEWLDALLEEPVRVDDLAQALVPALPRGLTVRQVHRVDLKEPALQTQIVSAEYRVTVEWDESPEDIKVRIDRMLAAPELMHERRGRQYDLRPLIEQLRLIEAGGGQIVLMMRLMARQGATARPEAVLQTLEMAGASPSYHRLGLIPADTQE